VVTAAAVNYVTLLVVRFLFGAGEAGAVAERRAGRGRQPPFFCGLSESAGCFPQCVAVEAGAREVAVGAPHFSVRRAPGSVGSMTITMKRYANQPTAAFPWDR
jgi:hypothetical protein